MGKSVYIQARVDPETKEGAQKIFRNLNLSLSQAIGIFLRQVIYHRGLPFELRVPNEETVRAIEELETGTDVHEAATVDELFQDLNS